MIDLGMTVPEILEELEDSLGPDAVWKLTGLFGGTETHIPHQHSLARSILTEQLGDQITHWLYETYGPGRIQIPLGPHSSRARKMAAFRAALLSRQPHRKIARSLGCHVRTVERAKRELVTAGFL
ncbi:helix-turn-helix domain-containing protein [Parasedimentitalea huanghaiensis]|uniref:Mor transcription activator domain-containing protein n=1 Tax=Parasedimentitalea huanghaiensis TaxID=2682100 RepID=A0A6L6WQR3_9RHOB|nr:helix-turn-helix domain-containing protein [Zongyanglinia huanghaiensis]MVO18267.1 hypothetical protein [Zongyanglinia huanghaiensis]